MMAYDTSFPPAPASSSNPGMPMPPVQSTGGFGGIGGFLGSDRGRNILSALGHSLLTGTRDNPLGGFSTAFDAYNQRSLKQAEEERERASWGIAFGQLGMNDPQLQELAQTNPQAAQMVWEQRLAKEKLEREDSLKRQALQADATYTQQLMGGMAEPAFSPSDGAVDAGSPAPVAGPSANDWSMPPPDLQSPAGMASAPKTAQAIGTADPAATGAAAPSGNSSRQSLMQLRDAVAQRALAAQNPTQLAKAKLALENIDFRLKALDEGTVKPTADIQEYQFAREQGFDGSFIDFQLAQKRAGATNVTQNAGGGKFDEEFAKSDATALASVSTAGIAAQRNMGRIDQLGELLNNSPTGWEGAAKQRLGEWGINTDGMDAVQAASAAINSLVPEQRQPGSGTMSDADLALFKQSLPRIINQPGGNQMILQTMRGIAQYDAEGARIVQSLRNGEIDRSQAFAALQARENPLASFKVPEGSATPAPGNSTPASRPRAKNPQTGEVVEWDGKGWVAAQ